MHFLYSLHKSLEFFEPRHGLTIFHVEYLLKHIHDIVTFVFKHFDSFQLILFVHHVMEILHFCLIQVFSIHISSFVTSISDFFFHFLLLLQLVLFDLLFFLLPFNFLLLPFYLFLYPFFIFKSLLLFFISLAFRIIRIFFTISNIEYLSISSYHPLHLLPRLSRIIRLIISNIHDFSISTNHLLLFLPILFDLPFFLTVSNIIDLSISTNYFYLFFSFPFPFLVLLQMLRQL